MTGSRHHDMGIVVAGAYHFAVWSPLMTIEIVIAEDHGLVRAGLRMLLGCDPNFRVVGEADNGYAALKLVEQLSPHVLLTDIGMPGLSGIELAAKLRSQGSPTRVLIVSVFEDQERVNQAIAAGAAGYLPKRAMETELSRAIHVVFCGGTYLPTCLRKDQAPSYAKR